MNHLKQINQSLKTSIDKLVSLVFILSLTLSILVTNNVYAATINFTPNSTATIENTNKPIHFNAAAHNTDATIDSVTGNMSGHAWSEDLGWINLSGVTINQNNTVTGQATVENTNNKIDFNSTPHNSNVTVTQAGQFSGHAWSEDLGWVNFANLSTVGSPLVNPPTPPQNLTASKPQATPQNGINLTWQAPANNNGSPITDYIIQYKESTSSTWLTFNDGTNTNLTTTVTGLDPTKTYNFQVIAVNSAGNSNPSNMATSEPASLTISTTNNNLTINLTPNPTDQQSANHTINTNCNYDNNCTLQLSTTANTTQSQQLIHTTIPTNIINPLSSSTPQTLTNNTCGFRLPSNTTTFGQNTDYTTKLYLPVQPDNSPSIINNNQTNTAIVVEYSIKIDSTQPSGAYRQTVRYTLVANP